MSKNNKDIRSARINPKYSNQGKLKTLRELLSLFIPEVNKTIDILWNLSEVPKLLNKDITDLLIPKLKSARMAQVAAKQASAVVRSIRNKQKKKNYNSNKPIFNGAIELDSRFIEIIKSNTKKFSYWITLNIPNYKKINLPFNLTSPMIRLINQGFTLKDSQIRILPDGRIDLFFERDCYINTNNRVVGVDIGIKKCITTSDGNQESTHQTGNLLENIINKITRKQKGSKAYGRACKERTNQINYSCKNDIKWNEINKLFIEDIKNMKFGRNTSKSIKAWVYPEIRMSLVRLSSLNGVHLVAVNPAYTSQTCSHCGNINSTSRRGETYCCVDCGIVMDADHNAAINILNRGMYSSPPKKPVLYEYVY